jgi:homospermidine synthase
MSIERLLLLGCGTIQRSLIELLHKKKHLLLKTKEIIILCPEDIPQYICKIIPKIIHIRKYLTEDNQDEILNKLMDEYGDKQIVWW